MSYQSQRPQPAATDSPPRYQPTGLAFPTKGYLPDRTRRESIEALNQTLADTTDLLLQTKFAHWNVRGPNFYQLHELFDDLAEALEAHADDVAERATALGGRAMGTTRMAAAGSRLPEMPGEVTSGAEFVELLAERLAIHDANLYESLRRVSAEDDLDTADLLNEVSREVSKFRWFLEAHFVTDQQAPGRGGQVGAGRPASGPRQPGEQPMEGQPTGDQQMEGPPMEERPMEGQPTGGQPMEGRLMEEQSMEGRPMGDQRGGRRTEGRERTRPRGGEQVYQG